MAGETYMHPPEKRAAMLIRILLAISALLYLQAISLAGDKISTPPPPASMRYISPFVPPEQGDIPDWLDEKFPQLLVDGKPTAQAATRMPPPSNDVPYVMLKSMLAGILVALMFYAARRFARWFKILMTNQETRAREEKKVNATGQRMQTTAATTTTKIEESDEGAGRKIETVDIFTISVNIVMAYIASSAAMNSIHIRRSDYSDAYIFINPMELSIALFLSAMWIFTSKFTNDLYGAHRRGHNRSGISFIMLIFSTILSASILLIMLYGAINGFMIARIDL